jgi:rhodanese-related sulfurtransferase
MLAILKDGNKCSADVLSRFTMMTQQTETPVCIERFAENVRRQHDLCQPPPLVVDCRAPVEFKKGHIPGAVNVPLFDDLERSRIGKAYKREGKLPAVRLGMKYIRPKIDGFLEALQQLLKDRRYQVQIRQSNIPSTSTHQDHDIAAPIGISTNGVFVYCARGGMRSHSLAWLLRHSSPPIPSGGDMLDENLKRDSSEADTFDRNDPSGNSGSGTAAGERAVMEGPSSRCTRIIDSRVPIWLLQGGYKAFGR